MSDVDPLSSMDASANITDMISGMRAQLITQGWDKGPAEQVLVALWQNTAAQAWRKVYELRDGKP